MTITDDIIQSKIEAVIKELPSLATPSFINKIDVLHEYCYNVADSEPDALLGCHFLNAIKQHYRPGTVANGHIYLERYEIPQIQLFDVLITRFPFVTCAHNISNHILADWIDGEQSATVLDVGIGRGIQMAALVRRLSDVQTLKELTIIGIEPFTDAIVHAKKTIEQAARHAHFKTHIHIIEGLAENIDESQLRQLVPAAGRLVVNASLSLHHMPSVAQRSNFFSTLTELSPYGMVLTEPHSDHMTANWRNRTVNAWLHYGAIFRTIDDLDITTEEKNGIKMFFGREIADVVGAPDDARFERHEPAYHWQHYGRQAGLKTPPHPALPAEILAHEHINILPEDGTFMMKRDNTGVLAIIPLVTI